MSVVLPLVLTVLVAKQLLVTAGVLHTRRWLRPTGECHEDRSASPAPLFFVVVPALREVDGLHDTVEHLRAIAATHHAQVVIVTSQRERAEAALHPDVGDTVHLAAWLARRGLAVHLHHDDPRGVKADMLNFAVRWCRDTCPDDQARNAWIVVYDADSRPPLDSLDRFAEAITAHPDVSVFQQSARFVVRGRHPACGRLRQALLAGGATRASRFVAAYEIPRLRNRMRPTPAWKRHLCSLVFVNITGHGLCLRLTLAADQPMPPRSPLEDVHYSFLLAARNEPMMPVPTLDCAEVPETLRAQFGQLTRWVAGPARFRRYLHDPATRSGWRARALAMSAAANTAGWLSCAVLPAIVLITLVTGTAGTTALAAMILLLYAIQLLVVNHFMGAPAPWSDRLLLLITYPATCTLFGIAGAVGVIRLAKGGNGAGKTERR